MGIITIYILFSDDIKLLTVQKDSDYIFSIICIIVIFLYSFEFTISCIIVDKYNWSFYFWLDFLSILAMFLDVDWVYDGLIYGVSGQEAGVSKKSQNGNAKTLGNIFRAGRAAKIGSRAIRVLRIVILFNSSFYYESKKSMELGIKIFKTFDKNDPNINLTFDIYVKEHIYISSPILYAQVGDLVYGDYNFTESLRPSEKIIAFDDCLNIDPDPEIGYVN